MRTLHLTISLWKHIFRHWSFCRVGAKECRWSAIRRKHKYALLCCARCGQIAANRYYQVLNVRIVRKLSWSLFDSFQTCVSLHLPRSKTGEGVAGFVLDWRLVTCAYCHLHVWPDLVSDPPTSQRDNKLAWEKVRSVTITKIGFLVERLESSIHECWLTRMVYESLTCDDWLRS